MYQDGILPGIDHATPLARGMQQQDFDTIAGCIQEARHRARYGAEKELLSALTNNIIENFGHAYGPSQFNIDRFIANLGGPFEETTDEERTRQRGEALPDLTPPPPLPRRRPPYPGGLTAGGIGEWAAGGPAGWSTTAVVEAPQEITQAMMETIMQAGQAPAPNPPRRRR
jgi:hypothetical protein